MAAHLAHRHLVRAPVALFPLAVDLLGTGPAFWRTHDDHRPGGALGETVAPCVLLNAADVVDDGFERLRHQLMHCRGIVAFDEMRKVAVAAHEMVELVVRNAREHGRIGDLVAVEVQDWQHGAVARGIEELVGMPARGERPRLGLPVTDDAGDDQVRIIESRAMRVRKRIAEFAAFVDRAWRLGRHMARNSAGKRKLGEEALHALLVPGNIRIDFAVGPLEIGVGDDPRAPVAGADHVDHVEVKLFDQAIEVCVDEVEAGRRAPMAEEPRLDVLLLERLAQQRVVEQIDLADGQIVGGAPVGVDERGFLLRQFDRHLSLRYVLSRATTLNAEFAGNTPLRDFSLRLSRANNN